MDHLEHLLHHVGHDERALGRRDLHEVAGHELGDCAARQLNWDRLASEQLMLRFGEGVCQIALILLGELSLWGGWRAWPRDCREGRSG